MKNDMDDNLEMLFLKCPHCGEVSRTDLWVTMTIKTTSCSASFSFDAKPKKSSGLMCSKCKQVCSYPQILDIMMREL